MESESKLWQDYRETWDAYSRSHAVMQTLADSRQPEKPRIEASVIELEKARLAYTAARDRLAKHLHAELPPVAPAVSHEKRVRGTAQLLWEMAGRPNGTAEGDWLRAERLVQSATGRTAEIPAGCEPAPR